MLDLLISAARAVLGLLLTLFVPGFGLVMALYPKKKDLGMVERIALGSTLSIALTLLIALFLDLGLGVDFTAQNMVVALVSFTVLCVIAWFIQTSGRWD